MAIERPRLLTTGRLFFPELAALITAGQRAHRNEEFYLSARVLAQAYRRWLRATPKKARWSVFVDHVKDGFLIEILR